MEYLIVGLLLFTIGNLVHLERLVARLQNEIKHIKEHLKEGKNAR